MCLLGLSLSAVLGQAPAKSAKPAASGGSNQPATIVFTPTTNQTIIDPTISEDAGVLKMLEPYAGKVRALDVVIGKLDGELKKTAIGGGNVGNFVTDGMRTQAAAKLGVPIDLAVSNSGGLRKNSIPPGNLRIRDIFEVLPFENALVELELTGDQLLKVVQIAIENGEPQSGARITYRTREDKKSEFLGAVLIGADGQEKTIVPTAKYRVITTDYLLNVEGGKFAILQESKVKNPLGLTIRDAIIEYVRAEAAAGRSIKAKLDGRFRREGPGPVIEP
jgi:2',3'-cyclic-nucleotide 2'-phosphodiesterase (5'-nucleotidase family)